MINADLYICGGTCELHTCASVANLLADNRVACTVVGTTSSAENEEGVYFVEVGFYIRLYGINPVHFRALPCTSVGTCGSLWLKN